MVQTQRWLLTTSLILLLNLLVGWSYSLPSFSSPISRQSALIAPPAAAADDLIFVPSPDGRWTAVINRTEGSLALQQPDETPVTVFPPGSTVHDVSWSPDSRHLLAVQTHWVFNEPAGTGVEVSAPIEIWALHLEEGKVSAPTRLFQPESGGVEALEGPAQILFGHWSPDSRHVLFWLGPLGASILADGLPAFVLEVNTGQVIQAAEWALVNSRYHSWAPDGSALALTAGGYRSAQINKWLNLVKMDSGEVTTVISQTEQIPGIVAWSPQGDLIAYAAVPAGETGEEWADLMTFDNPAIAERRIYLLDPITSRFRRLNQASAFQDAPLWSEDGALLYYAQRYGNQLQLMAADPKTGQASAVEGATIPVTDFVGYYGQSDLEALLAQRPGGELGILSLTGQLPTPAPTPPSADDLALIRFIFERHRPELGTLTEEFLENVAQGEYTDFTRQNVELTGDRQPEILVSGSALSTHLFVAILSRDATGNLQELFYTANSEGKYFAQVRTTIEDQRVIADFLIYTGGTGYLEMTWEQRWIECQQQQCSLVWSSPLLVSDRSANLAIERHYAVTEVEALDRQTIQRVTRHFGLSIPTLVEAEEWSGTARRFIGPNTLETYRRTGRGEYHLESQVQLEAGLEITREFSQETLQTNQLVYELSSQPYFGADGLFDSQGFNRFWAKVWGLPSPEEPEDPTWGYGRAQADVAAHTGPPNQLGEWVAGMIGAAQSPQCRLVVQRQAEGKFNLVGRTDLPCTINFSRLAWWDVTGDGQEELLLLTLPPEMEAEGQIQRLYLFSTTEDQLLELATLDGYINGADGMGIRWENSSGEEFRVEAGLPLVDLDNFPTLEEINLIRQFQTYEWDNQSRSFQVVE